MLVLTHLPRRWCSDCQAEREGLHVHGDPLEKLTREELLGLLRAGIARAAAPVETPGPRSCNRHIDCDHADHQVRRSGKLAPDNSPITTASHCLLQECAPMCNHPKECS